MESYGIACHRILSLSLIYMKLGVLSLVVKDAPLLAELPLLATDDARDPYDTDRSIFIARCGVEFLVLSDQARNVM